MVGMEGVLEQVSVRRGGREEFGGMEARSGGVGGVEMAGMED